MSERNSEEKVQECINYGTSYYLVYCGLCGYDQPTTDEVQVTKMVCQCGAEIVFSKNEEGHITVSTTDLEAWEDVM